MAKRPQDMLTGEDKRHKHTPGEEPAHTDSEDEDIYEEEGADELQEDDEIEAWEEGFMRGVSGAGSGTHCAHCGKELKDSKKATHEKIIDGSLYTFCSSKCADSGIKR